MGFALMPFRQGWISAKLEKQRTSVLRERDDGILAKQLGRWNGITAKPILQSD
jgi:hypothetical protein